MEDRKTLSETLKELNKQHGKDSIQFIGDNEDLGKIESESTNCYSIDQLLGCGGLPKGRVVEIFGAPSGGKSTMALYLIAQMQKRGLIGAYIDAEFSFSVEYARKLEVDISKLIFSRPDSGEEALDMVEKLVKSGEVGIIVVDSTAALVPEKELEGNIEDAQVAMQARLLSKGLRRITGELSKSKTILIFISQLRDKIGSFCGPTKDATGGNAIKFYSSVRLQVSKIKTHKDKEEVVTGNRLKVEAVKNKVGLPFRSAEIDLYFEKGIDVVGDIFDVAVSNGIISTEGKTFSYAGEKIGVGRDNSVDFMRIKTELFEKVKSQVMLIGKSVDEKEKKDKKDKKI